MPDLSKIRFLPLKERQNKIQFGEIMSLREAISSKTEGRQSQLFGVAEAIIKAQKERRRVIWFMGAHVIRRGNSRILIDLMERGFITHLAANFATAIHDFEFSYIGETLEDVEVYIKDGKFGHWDETGRYINFAIREGYDRGMGMGEAIGKMIHLSKFPHRDISVFAAAYRLGIPVTVHKAIGCDITDQHPAADFITIGRAAGIDFFRFIDSVCQLEGGVFLNLGSQVMGPETYLKALSIARNLADREGKTVRHFTTAVFDLINLGNWKKPGLADYKKPGAMKDPRYYFRPLKTILIRTIQDGEKSFYVRGDFRKTIPALYRELTK